MGERICRYCEFWQSHHVRPGLGFCQRNAPQPASHIIMALAEYVSSLAWKEAPDDAEANDFNAHSLDHGVTHWPVTEGMDWCGEFRQRPDNPPDP